MKINLTLKHKKMLIVIRKSFFFTKMQKIHKFFQLWSFNSNFFKFRKLGDNVFDRKSLIAKRPYQYLNRFINSLINAHFRKCLIFRCDRQQLPYEILWKKQSTELTLQLITVKIEKFHYIIFQIDLRLNIITLLNIISR